MLEKFEITETQPVDAAVVHVSTPRAEIQPAMESAIKELIASVAAQGIGPAGALFAHHTCQEDRFDFEVGVPVSGPVRNDGRVMAGRLPGTTVVRTVYHGGYEGLHEAWSRFTDRVGDELGDELERRGWKTGETFWEAYLQGPETDPDPSTYRTALVLPLASAR